MSTLGQQLLQPESGWKRYNFTQLPFDFISDKWEVLSYSEACGGEGLIFPAKINPQSLKFKFYGDRIRILIRAHSSYSPSTTIKIDDITYSMANNYNCDALFNIIGFEKIFENGNKWREVEIVTGEDGYNYLFNVILDAIDINKDGFVKSLLFLIKQNDQYYTIKSEYYKNGNYESIAELEGKEILTQTDFKTYGIDDLNLLTETIDAQVVNGVDKGNLGSGKYFEISFNNEFKTIKQNEVAEISKDLTKGQKYYGSREAYSNNIVSNAFDDNYNTIYKPYDSFSAWVTVEFNEPKEIIKYTVNTGDNSPNVSTSLYFSDNNIDFIKVGESEYYGNSPSNFSKIFKSYGFHKYWRVYRGQGSNWVEFKEIEMMGYNYPKMLLIYNFQLYTFNNTEIILSPSQELDENNFINNGFIDATAIGREQWNIAFPDKSNLKLLVWTDDMSKTDVNIETEIIPFRPIDKLKKNSDICNILFKEA